MQKRSILILAGLGLITVAGCMTPRASAPDIDDGARVLELKAGDHIRVVTTRRLRYTVEVVEIRSTDLVGHTLRPREHETIPKGERVVIPYDEIALLEVRRFSPLATAGAVAVVGLIGVMVTAIQVVPAGLPVMP